MQRFVSCFSKMVMVALLILSFNALSLTAKEVYQKVKSSVYTLYSFDYGSRQVKARGSAIAIAKTVLATNCHVALSGNYLVVKIKNKPRVARLFYKNEQQDLCLLEIPRANFKPVKIRGSSSVDIGEVVYAIGNPKGTEKSLSKGIVSNKHRVRGGVWLQTDAAIYYGSSGGGLFDEQGNLIGITTKMGGNFGFAIPTEWIMEVMSPKNNKALSHQNDRSDQRYRSETHRHNATPKPKPKHDLSHAYRKLSHLGTYGRSHIGLYRNNRECFILIPGRNQTGAVVSVTLWNPRFVKTLVIFPSAPTAKQAMVIIYGAVIDKKTKKQTTYQSDNILRLANYNYRLYGTQVDNRRYPFFVARFNKDPMTVLRKVQQFTVIFKDPDPRIGSGKMTYQLDGFDQAISAYGKQCQR